MPELTQLQLCNNDLLPGPLDRHKRRRMLLFWTLEPSPPHLFLLLSNLNLRPSPSTECFEAAVLTWPTTYLPKMRNS